jgi:hypothetical protein
VTLHPTEILRRLREWRGDIELLNGTADRVTVEIPTNDLPLLVNVFRAPLDAYAGSLHEALIWSPAWPECRGALMRCQSSIVVTLAAHRPINHASLLLAFLVVLDTTLNWLGDGGHTEGILLHWIPAQQVLGLERYRSLRTELGPCGPAINVRIANATGRPGELLADTVGLAVLGLPDLQTVFSAQDPAEVTRRLMLNARAMFVGDRLDCQWIEEGSLVPPERDVLTLQLD